ncbi:hypothetical protein ACFQZ4_50495 [Catellatospora coxensis]
MLSDELAQLETDTFEILDVADIAEDSMAWSSCSTSSCCSTSSSSCSSCCSTSCSCGSTSSCA